MQFSSSGAERPGSKLDNAPSGHHIPFMGTDDTTSGHAPVSDDRLAQAMAWFDGLQAEYLTDEEARAALEQRAAHMRRASQLARKTAQALGWSRDDIILAGIMALVHDVGRFEQYRLKGSFIDDRAADHTVLGPRMITDAGILDGLLPEQASAVLEAISRHNNHATKTPQDTFHRKFALLLRDTDKLEKLLDTAAWFAEHPAIPPLDPVADGPVNPGALADIMSGRKVRKKHVASTIDYRLLQLSWVFELVHPSSFRQVRDTGIADRIAALLASVPDTRPAVLKAQEYLSGGADSTHGQYTSGTNV